MKRKSLAAFIVLTLVAIAFMALPNLSKPEVYIGEIESPSKEDFTWPEQQPVSLVLYDEDGNIVDTGLGEDEEEAEAKADAEADIAIPETPTADKTIDDHKSAIVEAGVMYDELDFCYLEPDPTHEVDPSYSSPETEEPDPTHELDSYSTPEESDSSAEAEACCEFITADSEAMDGDDEIGPPIAPPEFYFEEEDIIAPELDSDSKPLAEEAEPPIDNSLEDSPARII